MPQKTTAQFLEPIAQQHDINHAQFVVLPIPYDATASYQKGTRFGPDAILEASDQLELFDEELHDEFYHTGIFTHAPVDCTELSPPDAQQAIYHAAKPIFLANKNILALGGEHAVSAPIIKAAQETYPDLTVLHFDAHADLRDTYEGSPFNHACVMRRVFDLNIPFISVGIRSFCKQQFQFIQQNHIKIITPRMIAQNLPTQIQTILNALSDHVYITFDIDALDPAVAPGTGTPEPGGLNYHDTLDILYAVGRAKTIVATDLVETLPLPHNHVTEFVAAKIAYKLIAAAQLKKNA